MKLLLTLFSQLLIVVYARKYSVCLHLPETEQELH